MRKAIIEEALSWVNTPYHEHARVKNVGVDCAQLVVGIAHNVGLITDEDVKRVPYYPVQWHLHNDEEWLVGVLDSYGCVRIDKQQTKPGDIITFRFGRVTSHLGIMVNEQQFVHALQTRPSKVVINTLQQEWMKRWTYTFTFPGVIDG